MTLFPQKSYKNWENLCQCSLKNHQFLALPPTRIRLPPPEMVGGGAGENLGERDEKCFSIFGWKGCILTSLSCRESKSVTKKIVDI